MDTATFFFDVGLPSSFLEANTLYSLKECLSNKVIGVCTADAGMLKCWISKDTSFKLEIDTDQEIYFSYRNQQHRTPGEDLSSNLAISRLDCFSHGLLSPYKLDDTSVKIKVFRNGNSKRED